NGLTKRLARDRSGGNADAAECATTLDHGDTFSELGGLHRGALAGGAAAYAHEMVGQYSAERLGWEWNMWHRIWYRRDAAVEMLSGTHTSSWCLMSILALNSGSSSLKFALYDMQHAETRLLAGSLEGIGGDDPTASVRRENESATKEQLASATPASALEWMVRCSSARGMSPASAAPGTGWYTVACDSRNRCESRRRSSDRSGRSCRWRRCICRGSSMCSRRFPHCFPLFRRLPASIPPFIGRCRLWPNGSGCHEPSRNAVCSAMDSTDCRASTSWNTCDVKD